MRPRRGANYSKGLGNVLNSFVFTCARVVPHNRLNGGELISLVNLGAAYGVGFGMADENIRVAHRLKSRAQADCVF